MTGNPIEIVSYTQKFFDDLIAYSPKIVAAFLMLVVGLYFIRIVNRLVRKIMLKREIEPTLSNFLADLLLWAMRALVFVEVVEKLGVASSSFVAIIGAAGLAVGLALQGSLSNFAGGVLIILFKPFRVGDTIEFLTHVATVHEIQIFSTKLIGPNNQTIIIPNALLSNGTIINHTTQGQRRIDLTITIPYDSDLKMIKPLVLDILKKNPKVLKTPAPEVGIKELTDKAILIYVRPWAKNQNYAKVVSETLEQTKMEFDAVGIQLKPIEK